MVYRLQSMRRVFSSCLGMHLAIIPNETERIRKFVRGLTFSIRSAVFRASREGDSFQSIMSTAKEAELMEREEFGDPKRARTVHSSNFQGEEIIVGFQGPHNSSHVRDFLLLVEIPII